MSIVYVARSVGCLCVCMTASPAKMTELTEMPFGGAAD